MPVEETEQRRRRWAGLLPPLVLFVVVAGALAALVVHRSNGSAAAGGAPPIPRNDGYDATLVSPARPAPPLALRNYLGEPVNIRSLRGRAVLVTFLYTHCVDTCPLITAALRVARDELGAKASRVRIVAVSVDPKGDTRRAVAAFLARHRMTGHMLYLIGSRAALRRTAAAWSIVARRDPAHPALVAHSTLVYGITASGKLATIYPSSFAPSQIVHDVPVLASR